MKKNKFLITLIILTSLNVFASTKLDLKKVSGKTEFIAIGNPGFLKIHGKGAGPEGSFTVEDQILKGEVEIDLTNLDTGMNLRNTHMKEKYLEVNKYPKAKLIIENYKLPAVWSVETPELKSQKINGIIEIHGQKKPVEVNYSIAKNSKVTADFEVTISDFGIDIPSFMGVTVADKVAVKIQTELKEKN